MRLCGDIFAVVLVVAFASFTGFLLVSALLNPLLNSFLKPELENDEMCGITTAGGQDNCWGDCMIITAPRVSGQAVREDPAV